MKPQRLTPRQRQIVGAIVRGYHSNRALAEHLGISENTASRHLHDIYHALDIHDRVTLVLRALKEKLVAAEDV